METKIEEIWKDVPGFEGFYKVSNMGRVMRLDTTVKHWCGGVRKKRSKILKSTGKPYPHVSLCVDNVKTSHQCHQLVAKVFIPNPDNKTRG